MIRHLARRPAVARSMATGLAATALACAVGQSAQARPIDSGSFAYSSHDEFDACGFPVRLQIDTTGTYAINEATGATEGEFFSMRVQSRSTGELENLDNGRVATYDAHGTFREVGARVVASTADSVTLRWKVIHAGIGDRFRDDHGRPLYVNVGNIVEEFEGVFARDGQPGGGISTKLSIRPVGRWDLWGVDDLCPVVVDLVG